MTTMAMPATVWPMKTSVLVGAGVLLGLAYTLSPLSVLSLAALVWVTVVAGRGLSENERRWFWSIMSISVLVRLIAIALLFYTADPAHPFASFFGDEELYKFRTIWLRNVGQGIPVSPADVIYSFDDVGHTSYIYVLAYVQAFVGDAPYGLHVLSMVLYLSGVLGLYRLARRSYGSAVAMGGLLLLLFMPSLGLWSISVLKEPMNVLMIATEMISAVMIVRAPRYWQKLIAVVVVIAAALAMESLRTGGALTAAVGTTLGLLIAFIFSRGRRVAFAMMLAPIALYALASMPAVQTRALSNLRDAAFYHAGHVLTLGYSYQLVNPRYYPERLQLRRNMPADDAARFAVKAVAEYFVQPLPWDTQSRAMLGFIPEQLTWYALVLLLPFGIYAGLKRDVLVTSMLFAHAAAAIMIVALTSGNIGTLIRHRALALPYVIWLSAVGAHEGIRRLAEGRANSVQRSSDGDR